MVRHSTGDHEAGAPGEVLGEKKQSGCGYSLWEKSRRDIRGMMRMTPENWGKEEKELEIESRNC